MDTPSQKAKQLFDKFTQATVAYDSGDHSAEGINQSLMVMVNEAKRCAMITVEEILECAPISPVVVGQYYENTSDRLSDAIDYWLKVKEEIEKL